MKTPNVIHAYPGSLIYADKQNKHTTEYIKASLLKDDKWLADNGLVRICRKCHGQREIPVFIELHGDTYIHHYEPCYDCQQITVSGF